MGNAVKFCWLIPAVIAAGCATSVPRPAQVVTMSAQSPAPDSAYPAEGAIWRLDDSEFKALGPLPVEPEPLAATAVPVGYQDYRNYGYIAPPPPVIYPVISYGAWFGFGSHSHSHRPRYSHGARRFRHR